MSYSQNRCESEHGVRKTVLVRLSICVTRVLLTSRISIVKSVIEFKLRYFFDVVLFIYFFPMLN